MTLSNEQIRAAISEQASDWFVENRGASLDREARVRFIAWLKSSPVHVEEYLRIAELARDLAAAAKDSRIPLESLIERSRAGTNNVITLDPAVPVHRVSHGWSLAVAAALVFVAVGGTWLIRDGERFGLPRTYSTVHGEQSVRVLPDGSVLHLNTDSQVTVHFSRRERAVDLDRGQALFQVVHDGARQFRDAARDAQILDVGTQFDVYRRSNKILVTVVEGTVAVYAGQPPLSSASPLWQTALRVDAGHQVQVGGQVSSPVPVDAHASVAWLQQRIAFENRPLGEVADEFNRYGRSVFEIDDETLRALPITGVFDAYDSDSFAAFLATLNGVVVRKTPPRIRVLRAPLSPWEPHPVAR